MCQWDDKISGDNLSSVYNSVMCKYNHKNRKIEFFSLLPNCRFILTQSSFVITICFSFRGVGLLST